MDSTTSRCNGKFAVLRVDVKIMILEMHMLLACLVYLKNWDTCRFPYTIVLIDEIFYSTESFPAEIPHCAPSEDMEARRFSWLPDHTPSGGKCTANFLCDGLMNMDWNEPEIWEDLSVVHDILLKWFLFELHYLHCYMMVCGFFPLPKNIQNDHFCAPNNFYPVLYL